MPLRLDTRDAISPIGFPLSLRPKREASQDVEQAVRSIIAEVVARGDQALIELSRKSTASISGPSTCA